MSSQLLPLFPLQVVVFPRTQLPLHIFEPRYRSMVSDALARDRMIGMIQPREPEGADMRPALFDVGCLGRIADVEAMEDGRYNIVLEGVALFKVLHELEATTAFRQAQCELLPVEEDEALSAIERAAVEREARRFAVWLGYRIDWDGVSKLDDATFVNAAAQIAPFDVAAKQALLEIEGLSERAELLMQLMRFASSGRDPGETRATLQ